jgi:hypothetical protein
MIKIYNFNNNPLSIKNGSYGGQAGGKDGILINNEEWMLKYPKNLSRMVGENASYSTAPLSEYIGSHIFEILDFDVHKTLLGEKNDKLVVACKDFATDKMLLEIRTLKNHMSKELAELLEGSPVSSAESHVVDFKELLLHLDMNPLLSKVEGIKERFFEQSIVDVFISNNDRNNGNWGILREKGKPDTLAPIFDNGSCFLSKISEDKIGRLLQSAEITNNAVNVLTAYGENGHLYSAKTYFKTAFEIPEFQEAVKKIIPRIKSKTIAIFAMIDEIPEQHVSASGKGIDVMSAERKLLYKTQMQIRIEKLLQPLLEKVVDLQINRIESGMSQNISLQEQIFHCKQISDLKALKHAGEIRETNLTR